MANPPLRTAQNVFLPCRIYIYIYLCSNVRKFERFLFVGVSCDVWSSVCVNNCIYVRQALLLFYVIMPASSCAWMAHSHNYYTDIYQNKIKLRIFT